MKGISTKLLYETRNGKIVGLALGNLLDSSADLICFSHYGNAGFAPNSVIGQLSDLLFDNGFDLNSSFGAEFITSGYQLFDFSEYGLTYKILVICLGDLMKNESEKSDHERGLYIQNNIQRGLKNAIEIVRTAGIRAIDISALGVQYGYLERSKSFDILLQWANEVLLESSTTDTVRFVIYNDIDAFIDFYENLSKRRTLQNLERHQQIKISTKNYGDHRDQIKSALNNLQADPRSVILICRNIIETIAKRHTEVSNQSLYNTISLLKDIVPPSIYSFFTTCRLLGNFANHDLNFYPTRRDAEGVLLLTVRIVEWHLSAI